METILLKNGIILTQNENRDIIVGDVLIEGDYIKEVGKTSGLADIVIDCSKKIIVPGFIQTHVHLIQTLFRSQADDLSLIDWLTKRIYLLEMAHTHKSVYWSGMLSCVEMLSAGTTCVVDMGTVLHTNASFEALRDSGMRGYSGKLLMDKHNSAPEELIGDTQSVIKESYSLLKEWHKSCNDRLRYLFAPRFALSCTDELLTEVVTEAIKHDTLIHTHAAENKNEVHQVRTQTGLCNVEYLGSLGLLLPRLLLAHCIWINNNELNLLYKNDIKVLHCPLANLKLASGVANVPAMCEKGINVSLGSDGAACNNTLDMFLEMRFAALIHKVRTHDPTIMPAQMVLDMATRNGAKAIGMEGKVGIISPGTKADITVINTNSPHMTPFANPVSSLVYAANSSDVVMTFVDGKLLYDGAIKSTDVSKVIEESSRCLDDILGKVRETQD